MRENGLQWNNSWIWWPGQSLNFGYHLSDYRASFTVQQQIPNQEPGFYEEKIQGTLHSIYMDLDINIEDRLLNAYDKIRGAYRNGLAVATVAIG